MFLIDLGFESHISTHLKFFIVFLSLGAKNMSILSQFTALATGELYKCDSAKEVYENLVGNINHETNLAYGKEVSERVANFVSTPPVSDKVGEVNKALEYIANECSRSEIFMKNFADYNQNIYDSLDLYKNTTPHAIPEFGELSIIMVGLSFVGIIAITKRHEIASTLKKLVRF